MLWVLHNKCQRYTKKSLSCVMHNTHSDIEKINHNVHTDRGKEDENAFTALVKHFQSNHVKSSIWFYKSAATLTHLLLCSSLFSFSHYKVDSTTKKKKKKKRKKKKSKLLHFFQISYMPVQQPLQRDATFQFIKPAHEGGRA